MSGEPHSSATDVTGDIPWSPCSKAVLEYDNHMANEALGYAGKALLDKIHNETRILKDPSYFFLNSLEWRLQKTSSEKQTTYVALLKEKATYFIHYPSFWSHLFFILFPAKASKSQEEWVPNTEFIKYLQNTTNARCFWYCALYKQQLKLPQLVKVINHGSESHQKYKYFLILLAVPILLFREHYKYGIFKKSLILAVSFVVAMDAVFCSNLH